MMKSPEHNNNANSFTNKDSLEGGLLPSKFERSRNYIDNKAIFA